MRQYLFTTLLATALGTTAFAQPEKHIVNSLQTEATQLSQLEDLGQSLLDSIGPRLIGSPGYNASQKWIIDTYNKWGVQAWNEVYGTWPGWERGTTAVNMTWPRQVQLNAMQLAWSPSTSKGKAMEAQAVHIPMDLDSVGFVNWLATVKGKVVLASKPEFTGRTKDNWETFGMKATVAQYEKDKEQNNATWAAFMKKIGMNPTTLVRAIDKAGAAAVFTCNWTGGWGAYKIAAARTAKIPNVNLTIEDYTLLYRLSKKGTPANVNLQVTNTHYGEQPVANTMAMIKGTEKPEEYVMLSAHLDSWEAGTGATDNGSGTILMMEVMRILKKHYPNPKRSIIVGHWGGEEQGLNGSRAYIADHPEMREKISVLFNQDNGTGRISNINGNGFIDAYDYFSRWFQYLPDDTRKEIKTNFPGDPGGRGSSDYASFIPYNVPAFFLLSNGWDYSTYTWHTALDTYDKLVFDDIRRNAATIATLVYLACEEPTMFSRNKAEMPMNIESGKRNDWPKPSEPARDGKKY